MKVSLTTLILGFYCLSSLIAQPVERTRWRIEDSGEITWNIEAGKSHFDNIEMSGQKVSVIVSYGVDEKGKLSLSRQVIFPMLRFFPNKTRDHLSLVFGDDAMPRLLINGKPCGTILQPGLATAGLCAPKA